MKKTVGFVTFSIAFLLISSFCVMAGTVPDTGQTKCYDYFNEIECPAPGEYFYGQDANYTINPPSYTKLDANGNYLPESASFWVMVRDNVTGLIWEVKTNQDGVMDYANPHDADNICTWYDSNPETNGGDAGAPGDGTDTEDFISALNFASFGGFSDWRLPNREELRSIVDYGTPSPSIDTTYFPNTKSHLYWSSTTNARNPNFAWKIGFIGNMNDQSTGKWIAGGGAGGYVRAVRGGQSEKIYVDNGEGTVTDRSTGLMWEQENAYKMDWKSALLFCERLYLGGFKDWRLPNLKELESLVDLDRTTLPSIDTTYFPNTEAWGYWSSTPSSVTRGYGWAVFFNGGAADYPQHLADMYYVRAVRGGQDGSFLPVADFQATPTSGVAPLTVQYTDLSTGSIESWLWDFGDGQTSTLQNPSHTYNSSRNYTVTLAVTAPGGSDTETKSNYIKVAYYSNFDDVPPGYWAEEFIHKIYEAGITSGCSQDPLMYCPEDAVSRAQMAVFLERGINGSDYSPPDATGVFDDCPVSYWAADWVEQFYADGITSGCSTDPPLYCPDDLVTRAEMAVFLLRSMYGNGYTPPSAAGIFDDVPVTHWAANWIEQLYDEGITGGCSTDPPLYCPDDVVNRAQMAVFIVRAFGL